MPDPLDRLCRTDKAAGAASDCLPLLADGMAAAGGATVGKDKGCGFGRPSLGHDVEDLRNDVPRPLHDDGVADADVAPVAYRLTRASDAPDVILVVQRGVGHHDPADGDRLQ